jgi:NADH-quinone oxidoreductase subunit C
VADHTTEQTAQPDDVPPEAVPVDVLRQPLLDFLQSELSDMVLGSEISGDELWVRVDRSVWRRTAELCRDRLGLSYFCFLSGLDWQANPDLLGEKAWEAPGDTSPGAVVAEEDEEDLAGEADEPAAEEEVATGQYRTGVAGGDTRFQVFARLYNVDSHVGITLKADLPDDDPRVDSWVPVFRGADWHEREAWEMYGFTFDGHPRLRHIYLPTEFEGHPLRKDFPLLARIVKPWPGLVDVEPIPGEGDGGGESPGGDGATGDRPDGEPAAEEV